MVVTDYHFSERFKLKFYVKRRKHSVENFWIFKTVYLFIWFLFFYRLFFRDPTPGLNQKYSVDAPAAGMQLAHTFYYLYAKFCNLNVQILNPTVIFKL